MLRVLTSVSAARILPKGKDYFAHLEFWSSEEAAKAIKRNGYKPAIIGTRAIRMQWSHKPTIVKRVAPENEKLFVSRLPSDATREELSDVLKVPLRCIGDLKEQREFLSPSSLRVD
jgi:RNA recognition motif-containing protein